MKTKTIENNGIKIVVNKYPIEVSEVKVSDFQKEGTKTAVLKQTVETLSTYPSKSVSNEKQDNLFELSEFGFEENPPYVSKSTRVVFMDVPENSTVESVKAKLEKFPDATLYRELKNEPILTSNQKYAIKQGLRTMDDFANMQALRDSKTGELILDKNGKIQYKAVYFSQYEKEDVDNRTEDDVFYMSPELELEYNQAILVTG